MSLKMSLKRCCEPSQDVELRHFKKTKIAKDVAPAVFIGDIETFQDARKKLLCGILPERDCSIIVSYLMAYRIRKQKEASQQYVIEITRRDQYGMSWHEEKIFMTNFLNCLSRTNVNWNFELTRNILRLPLSAKVHACSNILTLILLKTDRQLVDIPVQHVVDSLMTIEQAKWNFEKVTINEVTDLTLEHQWQFYTMDLYPKPNDTINWQTQKQLLGWSLQEDDCDTEDGLQTDDERE